MAQKTELSPVVVTTDKRGVFFGYGERRSNGDVRLERARMCVYWSSDVKGVLGLAATGPSKNCKISPAVPAISLPKKDITAVIDVSPEAVEKWEAGPWAN